MNKKILIGSIIAVAILVGVSLTSVVGYQSVESNLKESPLFNVRSGRAIEKDGNDLTFDYVGKGEQSNIVIPIRDASNMQIQKWLKILSKMDSTTLKKLVGLLTKNHLNNLESTDVKEMLQLLSCNPNQFNNHTKSKLTFVYTMINPCTVDGHWQFGCFIQMLLLNIAICIILLIILIPTMNPAMTSCTMNAGCSE